jgi:hypothetical protein
VIENFRAWMQPAMKEYLEFVLHVFIVLESYHYHIHSIEIQFVSTYQCDEQRNPPAIPVPHLPDVCPSRSSLGLTEQ